MLLVSGPDFVAAPRWFDGKLAWLQWDHPNMPWDSTALLVGTVPTGEDGPKLSGPTLVAGGSTEHPESVMEPAWGPDGSLWFVSDRDSWWNLYRWDRDQVSHIAPVRGEIGAPAWLLGGSAYTFLPDGRIVAAVNQDGRKHLAVVDPADPDRPPTVIECELTSIEMVTATASGAVAAIAGGPNADTGPVRVSLQGRVDVLRHHSGPALDREWISAPETIDFTSADGRGAHAILYRPVNPYAAASPGERPPLLVVLHGGPTTQTQTSLSLGVQFWTTRGFAVADLDYSGSTGYGRQYRKALYGQWGAADVEDCLAVVRHLADAGIVDGDRAAIRGGSAGGFTTLAVLTHPENLFATGASYFGIADLEVLARHTHKFESRYCDQLIGPLPEAAEIYRERSPINHVDRLRVPLAVFQGAEDAVVPPEQSRMIVNAVRDKQLPCVYLEFAGERHGFRQSDSMIRSIETELWFYGQVFGFAPPVSIDPPADDGF